MKKIKQLTFNAVVGNPPYQKTTAKQVSLVNGQMRRKSIFQYFQIVADDIASGIVSLIYPGGRWIHRSGKGMEDFGKKQINDNRLLSVDFYPNANELFSDADIADGLSIVTKRTKKTDPGFIYTYHEKDASISIPRDAPGEKLISLNPYDELILQKSDDFAEKHSLKFIHDKILSQKLFGIESSFVQDNPGVLRLYEDGDIINYDKEVKVLVNDKAGKAGRSKWFVMNRNLVTRSEEYIDEWQVVVSSANAGGQKRDWQIALIDNHSVFGRSRVALASFKTKEEAENFMAFSKSEVIRFLYLMTDEALTSLGKRVIDLGDYTSTNKLIDFAQDVNDQLVKLLGLTTQETEYIRSKLRPEN